MKIYDWIYAGSTLQHAIVEVNKGEKSDIEEMLKLLDGDTVGHFGVKVTLICQEGYKDLDAYAKYLKNRIYYKPGSKKRKYVTEQFGFPNASKIRDSKRYYEVVVYTD